MCISNTCVVCQKDGSSGSSSRLASNEALTEVMTKLSMTQVSLEKATRVATKMMQKGQELKPCPSKKFGTTLADMNACLEKVEKYIYELTCLQKFKKYSNGKALEVDLCKKIQRGSAESLSELMELSKVLKAMWPKKAGDDDE